MPNNIICQSFHPLFLSILIILLLKIPPRSLKHSTSTPPPPCLPPFGTFNAICLTCSTNAYYILNRIINKFHLRKQKSPAPGGQRRTAAAAAPPRWARPASPPGRPASGTPSRGLCPPPSRSRSPWSSTTRPAPATSSTRQRCARPKKQNKN